MPNPLFERLFQRPTGQSTPLLPFPDDKIVTHAEFLSRAARFANLLANYGLEPGDRLAAQVAKSPEALELYAACVQAGIIFLPLNTAYTADELTYFIENSGAAMVICDLAREAELAPVADRLDAQILTLDGDGTGSLPEQAESQPADFPTADRGEDDLAALLYTSGASQPMTPSCMRCLSFIRMAFSSRRM